MEKQLPFFLLFILCLHLLFPQFIHAQAGSRVISSQELQEDFVILQTALEAMHPGLYKYVPRTEMDRHFSELKNTFTQSLSIEETYVSLAKFLAKIRCGHTYCNPFNQKESTRKTIYGGQNKLPFTFRIIEGKMIIDQAVGEKEGLQRGTIVEKINGVETQVIFNRLSALIHADGSNDKKRRNNLQVLGSRRYQLFDLYFPLVFPNPAGIFDLAIRDPHRGEQKTVQVQAISTAHRDAFIQEAEGSISQNEYDRLWAFEILSEKTAYLKMGTFVTWKMELDWKKFLDNSFEEIRTKQIPNLIIDIRDNGGGADEVYAYVARYLLKEPIQYSSNFTNYISTDKIPEIVAPHIVSWGNFVEKLGKKATKKEERFYVLPKTNDRKLTPRKNSFQGTCYLMVNAACNSATHIMANLYKSYGLATIVGEETGGNLRGINGSYIYFLTLPNSGIEVDIPLVGSKANIPQADQGVTPDIPIENKIMDHKRGIDTQLTYIKALISNK